MAAHDMTGLTGAWAVLNTIANLMIVAGYLLVPFTVLKYLPLSLSVRFAGALFFVTCALTHLSMAFNFENNVLMVINHIIQAGSVVWFVLGFWLLLRAAMRRVEAQRRE